MLLWQAEPVDMGSGTTTLKCHAGSSKFPLGRASAHCWSLMQSSPMLLSAAALQMKLKRSSPLTGVRMTGRWQTCIRQVHLQWWLGAVWAGEGVYRKAGVLVTCGMPSNWPHDCHACMR